MTDESIFAAALAIGSPAERAAYLDHACAGDPGLRRQVEELLAAHAADNPLDRPPADLGRTGAYEPPAERPGASVGPYKLLQEIGEGGMGTVFMAEQTAPVRRKVALKIIKPGMDSRQVVARFEAERQALSLMDHPSIARVLDAGETPPAYAGGSPRPFFVMELVHGVPITEFCDANKLSPRERLGLFVPVCQAIQHAHQKGIIHRDIKPGNILVTMYDDKPVPKVIDFGVAKAVEQRLTERTLFTQFGALVGTFEYMSPEQAEMNAFGVDTRSDVYSLGVLLYELLTGTTPLERQRLRGAALGEVVRLIKEEEPPRPSLRLSTSGTLAKVAAARRTEPAKLAGLVRGELDWIVMRCLEKDRTRRYDTASALARDVERYLHDEPVEACPPTLGYRLRKAFRKNRTAFSVAAGFVALLLAGIAGTTWGLFQADKGRRAAEAAARAERDERDMADAARRVLELTAASLQVDLDLAEIRVDENLGLLRLARTLKGMPDDAQDLRGFGTIAVLATGQRFAPLVPPITHDGALVTRSWFSPDGRTLLTLGKDRSARLWESHAGRLIAVLRKKDESVVNCGFSPDGRTVFTDDETSVARLWNVPEGSFRAETAPRPNRYVVPEGCPRYGIEDAVKIDGARLLTRRVVRKVIEKKGRQDEWEGPVELWDTATGRLVVQLDQPNLFSDFIQSFSFLGGGRWVTTREGTSAVLVYSAEDGRLLGQLSYPAGETIVNMAANPAGRRIAMVTKSPSQGMLLRMWDTASWQAEPGTKHLDLFAFDIQFMTDDLFILGFADIGGSYPELYRIGQAEPILGRLAPPQSFALATDLVHTGDGRLFDIRTRLRLRPPKGRQYHPDLTRFAPDGRFVPVKISTGSAELLDTLTEKRCYGGTGPNYYEAKLGWVCGCIDSITLEQGIVLHRLPPPDRLNIPPDLLELWAQVVVRGQLDGEGSFVKWNEQTWERKRQELAMKPAPYPDFPFPGNVVVDRLYWLRKEYESASDADQPRLAKQLQDRAEAAGDKAEAARWRAKAKQQ